MSFTIEELKVDQQYSLEKTFSEVDVLNFSNLSGDKNPIHLDESEAKKSKFGRRVVHGSFVSSLISTILGMNLPGKGTIYLAQNCKFIAPVFIGDTITVTCKVIEIIKEKNIVKLASFGINQHGKLVIDGTSTVMAPLA